MTGILDLMHALSYAWRAAAALVDDPQAYRRYATLEARATRRPMRKDEVVARGSETQQVQKVIDEFVEHQQQIGLPDAETSASDPREHIQRAITYYTNHSHLMKYPEYRQQGLPLTISLMESTIKQMNARVNRDRKVLEEKFRRSRTATPSRFTERFHPPPKILAPLVQSQQTGTNTDRKQAT